MEKFDFIETDSRIMEQKLRRHQLSQQEHAKLLKSLPDDKDHSEEIAVAIEENIQSEG